MMTAFQDRQTRYHQPAMNYVTQCIIGIFDMARRANPERPLGDLRSPIYGLLSHSIQLLPPGPLALPDYTK